MTGNMSCDRTPVVSDCQRVTSECAVSGPLGEICHLNSLHSTDVFSSNLELVHMLGLQQGSQLSGRHTASKQSSADTLGSHFKGG